MSLGKLKSDRYCVGGRQKTATKNNYGEKTSKSSKVLFGFYFICKRKKSMTVFNITIPAERLSDFFENLSKKGLNVTK